MTESPASGDPFGPRVRAQGVLRQAMPVYVALVLAALTVGVFLVVIELQDVLLLLFISFLLASAVSRPSARLEQLRIPRAIAAISIYVMALAVFAGVLWFVLPTLFGQLANLADRAPEYAERYDELRTRYDELAQEYPSLGSFDEQIGRFQSRIIGSAGDQLINLPGRTFRIFLDALAVFTISLLLVTSRERMLGFILSLTHPEHRAETRDVLTKMWERVGYYVRAKLIVMTIIGVLTYGALLAIGVPFPLLLAIVVAFGELIPRVGPWLARIPLFGIAALQGWQTLALTFVASVVIENGKGFAISPWVEGDQLDIPPLMVFVAVLVGAALLGPAGAFVAVPAAAMVQVLAEEVVIPWRRRQLAAAEREAAERVG